MKYDFSNTPIVIPFYQCHSTIHGLIDACLSLDKNSQIIIVDDGSQPPLTLTKDVSNVILLRNEKNLGKGASLQKAIDYAFHQNKSAVICMDADGQHSVDHLVNFFNYANQNEVDLLIGNRVKRFLKMPIDRYLSNLFSSIVLSVILLRFLPDVQCGYRFIALNKWAQLKCDTSRFEWEGQVILQAAWNNWNIAFIPIPTLYFNVEKSQIRRLGDTFRYIKMVVSECWKRFFPRD